MTGNPANRITKLFHVPEPYPFAQESLQRLGEAMTGSPAIENRFIKAGYTYFGQFVGHDMSFLPRGDVRERGDVPEHGDMLNDGNAVSSAVTPSLDLDTVYGNDTNPPHLDSSGRFWLQPVSTGTGRVVGHDLPRGFLNPAPRIVDARNDGNLITAQIQVAIMRHHNRLIDRLTSIRGTLSPEERVRLARETLVAHYHRVIVHDFLKVILHGAVYGALLDRWGKPLDADVSLLRPVPPAGAPLQIPIEFAAAAGRFGHSLVRRSYRLAVQPRRDVSARQLLDLSGSRMARDGRLSPAHLPQWDLFFGVDAQGARRLGPSLDATLTKLRDEEPNLAVRNLLRGMERRLPSGEQICQALLDHTDWRVRELVDAVGLTPLTRDEILLQAEAAGGGAKEVLARDFAAGTPLWYYLLCEAAARGAGPQGAGSLGPLGSLIVADTMLPLLRRSRHLPPPAIRHLLDPDAPESDAPLPQDSPWAKLTHAEREAFARGDGALRPPDDIAQLLHTHFPVTDEDISMSTSPGPGTPSTPPQDPDFALLSSMNGAGLAEYEAGENVPDGFPEFPRRTQPGPVPHPVEQISVGLTVKREGGEQGRWYGQLMLDPAWTYGRSVLPDLQLLPNASRDAIGAEITTPSDPVFVGDLKYELQRISMKRDGPFVVGSLSWKRTQGVAQGAPEFVVTRWKWPPKQ